jgi:hypothetical protein
MWLITVPSGVKDADDGRAARRPHRRVGPRAQVDDEPPVGQRVTQRTAPAGRERGRARQLRRDGQLVGGDPVARTQHAPQAAEDQDAPARGGGQLRQPERLEEHAGVDLRRGGARRGAQARVDGVEELRPQRREGLRVDERGQLGRLAAARSGLAL